MQPVIAGGRHFPGPHHFGRQLFGRVGRTHAVTLVPAILQRQLAMAQNCAVGVVSFSKHPPEGGWSH
ncbi:hypothetical protein Mkiyose1385_01770 [Mycobacterium kiyosense]|nr:hypothetical protein IWGMT90018_29410 [Mycobacterium kiyosense]GLD16078.1 hypothetical protein Mkiyose1385_01770 [Mycobacterium kiyosense]